MSRPFILDSLFISVKSLNGIGPMLQKLYEKFLGGKIVDLLFHVPSGLIDRRFSPKIMDSIDGQIASIIIEVQEHIPAEHRSRPYKITGIDSTGSIEIIFFNANKKYLESQLPIGEMRIISGKVDYYQSMPQMMHPDIIARLDEKELVQTVEPIYPLTAGITHKTMLKAIRFAKENIPDLDEWIDEAYLKKNKWESWKSSLTKLHNPEELDDLEAHTKFRERLAYDELLANQLALQIVRSKTQKKQGRSFKPNERLIDKALKSLPFTLTNGQLEAIDIIRQDMAKDLKMLRLLQGDVGSGKTIVAFFAMLNAIGANTQAAIMAPTEILANQHMESISEIADKLGLKTILLTGRDKGKKREAKLEQINSGEINIIIGTHALFQKDVEFHDLGLAIIDEQHRFGVHQRLTLSEKGVKSDMLVMTATPIPRTLSLTIYGDMDISILREKPVGRLPIQTSLIPLSKLETVFAGIKRKLDDKEQIYWVCPLVEESEKLDLAAAEDRFISLEQVFGDKVGLVHGRMKPAEKDAVMQRFSNHEISVLVSTTVIEVGVNVPNATVMILEHAERFGLSQIHQLRGRVGRGDKPSSCILLYKQNLNETAKKRLQTIRDTEDGFIIAEEDLKLRGTGEILGTKQSGFPDTRLAILSEHGDLLATAQDDARLIMHNDPKLTSKRGQALRTLLYLFEKDATIKYIASG